MIPVLYNADETRFINNGRGRLTDCISCIVTEERNGIYEMEFQYPITGIHFDELEIGRIVTATHDDNGDVQPFVIYSRSVPDLRGVCRFNAHHISYRLSDVVVMPFTAGSCAAALQGIKDNSINANTFTFWTDKSVAKGYTNTVPRQARNMLGGEENSILDVFGTGEYEFDVFDVKLHLHRGTDTGVEIRYSKNLTNLNQTLDESGCYNAIVPYWADTEGNLVTLPEGVLVYAGINPQVAYLTDHNLVIIRTENNEPIELSYSQVNAVPYDMSQYFTDKPTENELRQRAQERFFASDAWLPTDNLKVDFVQLWQTEEFKDYAALQRVGLCDTVSIYYPQVGIEAVQQKVVKTVYNVLLDRYDSIELGSVQTSLGQAIKQNILNDVPTSSMMDAAIQYATDLIRGGLGGYVVMTPGIDGYPQEILIMDTPDVNTAVNVWRFNQGGLGHSSTGYEGPFSDIALTADGRINASMITAGILNANMIKAGILEDLSGENYWNLASGQFVTKQGEIGPLKVSAADVAYQTGAYPYGGIHEGKIYTQIGGSWSGGNYIRRTELSGGTIYVLIVDESMPPENWNNWTQVLTISAFHDTNDGDLYSDFKQEGTRMFLLKKNATWPIDINQNTYVRGNLAASGTKSRRVETENYDERLLYSYETPSPMFGDIGEAQLDEEGICYVDLDDIFSETISDKAEYQVFLQKEGEGDCWIANKSPRYFVIQGTPGLKIAWELKAKQKDYQNIRLEPPENSLYEYEHKEADITDYITEQEAILYGNY